MSVNVPHRGQLLVQAVLDQFHRAAAFGAKHLMVAGGHPQGIVAELKSKNDRTAVLSSFYSGAMAVS